MVLPRPVARCRYWHRSLNPKKLIEVGFSRLAPRMTMVRTLKLYALPDQPATKGVRALKEEDVPSCCAKLNAYLRRYKLTPQLSGPLSRLGELRRRPRLRARGRQAVLEIGRAHV